MTGLGRKRKKTWRRKLAGFLAVCMMATSIQSTAFATASGEYESSSEEVVLDLSMDYMKEAIKESIEYAIHYSGDMAFSDAEGKASKYEEFLSGENVFELVSIPYADTVLYDVMPDDTSLRIFVRADEGQLKKMEQEASEAELKATDDALFAPEYEILGSEELIFLFTNRSATDYSFKLNVDGHFTPAIKVPSGETLGYEIASESETEEETEEETTAEETTAAEETAEGVGPSGETGGTVTDGGAGFGGGSGSGSDSGSGSSEIVEDAENQTDEATTTEDSNQNDGTGSEEGSGSSEEANAGSDTSEEQGSVEGGQTDNSTTDSDDQTSEGTDGSGSVSDNGVASDNGASSDNGTASEPGASSDNGTVSDNGSSSGKEEVKETKIEETSNDSTDSDDGEQSASIVSYNIPRVTATLDGEEGNTAHVGPNTDPNSDYVDDDMDWDDWFSADDDEDEYYSEDYDNSSASSSFSAVMSGTILEPVFVKTESKARGFAMFALFAAGNTDSSKTEVARIYANTLNALVPQERIFTADFFDYNATEFNSAVGTAESDNHRFYMVSDDNSYYNDLGYQSGLVQGLVKKIYENGKVVFNTGGNLTSMYPTKQETSNGSQAWLDHVIYNQDVTGMFTVNTINTSENKTYKTYDFTDQNTHVYAEDLPTGSSYKVTESALVNDYYKDSVTGHAATPSEAISYTPTTREFNGSFTNVTDDTKNHMVGYTNKVIRAEGTLKITKQLKSDTDKSKEPLTFTFEIYDVTGKEEPVDYETCKKFYASVIIPANAKESNVELKVPAGKYVVKELKTLRYDLVDKDSNPQSIEVKKDSSEEVIFVNKKVSDGYFSSVSTKVNTVNEDGQGSGFPLKNDRKYNSQNALQKVVAWLGSDNKENGDE